MKYETQLLIEKMYDKHQTMDLLLNEFSSEPFIIEMVNASKLPNEFCYAVLCQIALHKRADVPTMVGVLSHFSDSMQEIADALLLACEEDLLDFNPVTEQFIIKWEPEPKVYELIKHYQYKPPMIVPPKKVTSNRGRGNLFNNTDSLILKKNHHNEDICLDVINCRNKIPLQLNIDIIKNIRNSWKDLNKCKPGELFEDYKKRVAAFKRFEKLTMKDMALMVNNGNEFYLTHAYDKRGRLYCQGYSITYQGNDYQKACVELKHEEVVTGF